MEYGIRIKTVAELDALLHRAHRIGAPATAAALVIELKHKARVESAAAIHGEIA